MKCLSALILCLVITTCVNAAPATGKDRQVLLDVQPAAAPVPALKYQLLPEVSEMNPGNSVPAYLKCFAEQQTFFFSKESQAEREKLLSCPLTDIKPRSRDWSGYGGSALRQADYAARLEYCDWNILPQMRERGYALLLPEIQQMRTLARALAVRCRGEIVDRNYDGAVRTLKTLFALARDMGDHPTIISGMVGVAIADIALNLIEEFIQQPGAPNLYWALTGLPTPLVEFRKAILADRTLLEASLGVPLDGKRVWSRDDVATITEKIHVLDEILDLKSDEHTAAEEWMKARLKDAGWQAATRKELVTSGHARATVDKYPPEQVLFLYLFQRSRERHDESMKWMFVPYWQAESALVELQKTPMDVESKLTGQIVFGVAKIKGAHTRLIQRIAMLRVVEAIRLEAVKTGGKLPTSLSEVTSPLPIDPVSGKSFSYKLDGLTAILDAKALPTNVGTIKTSYEVRLRK